MQKKININANIREQLNEMFYKKANKKYFYLFLKKLELQRIGKYYNQLKINFAADEAFKAIVYGTLLIKGSSAIKFNILGFGNYYENCDAFIYNTCLIIKEIYNNTKSVTINAAFFNDSFVIEYIYKGKPITPINLMNNAKILSFLKQNKNHIVFKVNACKNKKTAKSFKFNSLINNRMSALYTVLL